MSRFFAKSDSESETESSENEMPQKQPVVTKAYLPSDDDEETKRVVRSGKDKSHEELKNILKVMKNHEKIKDMSKVLTDFEDLTKAFEKAKKVIEKEGIPRFYLRSLVELEDFVNGLWEDTEGRKAMNKNNAKGLTSLRQKLRKYNKTLETEINAYKENPDAGDAEEEAARADEDESDSDSEDEIVTQKKVPSAKPSAKPAPSAAAAESDGESDDSWMVSESESSSSDDEKRPVGTLTADFFRKKVVPDGETDAKKKKEKVEKKIERERKIQIAREAGAYDEEDGEQGGEWTAVPSAGGVVIQERPKIFAKDVEINHDVVNKKLAELMSARGKKGTDRNVQVDMLIELRDIAKSNALGDAMDCKCLLSVISAIFDYNPNIAASMKSDMWERCLTFIEEVMGLLMMNKETIIIRDFAIDEDVDNWTAGPPYRIRGCMLTIIERMDDEFTKMLQACDAHSTEYIDRLKDETRICKLIEDLEAHMKDQRATDDEMCRVFIKRIQHLYYKFDPTSQAIVNGTESPTKTKEGGKSYAVMDRLCKFIYAKDQTDRIRTRAILSHVYHYALHDRWFQARDLMLMSHKQDTINHYDIPTQILYNRAMVQLGICAFRQGFISQAHNCLVDIQSSGRAKELLAQGLLLQRQHERTAEQEKIEKRRQMPYHMHINLELLECVYLVSAMLIEIPYMAAHEFDARRRMISKNFHHVLRVSEKQTLVGPPESMREHVVAACKAMKVGDWKACANYIVNDKMNAKVWDLFYNSDGVRVMLKQKIQEESLRTYLFSYSSVYDSLSLTMLSEMFELDKSVVHSTISKMIISEELMASLDEPTQTVVMHRTEPTRLQSLALQLSEKVSSLVEQNERTLEMKNAGPSYFSYQRPGGAGGAAGGERIGGGGMGYQSMGERTGQYQHQGGYSGRRGGGSGGQRGGQRGGGGGRYNQYNRQQQQNQQSNYYHQREQEA